MSETTTNRIDAMKIVLRKYDYDFVVGNKSLIVDSHRLSNVVVKSAGELGFEIGMHTENKFVIKRSVFE